MTAPKSNSIEYRKQREHAFALADKYAEFNTLAYLVDRDQSQQLIEAYTTKVNSSSYSLFVTNCAFAQFQQHFTNALYGLYVKNGPCHFSFIFSLALK